MKRPSNIKWNVTISGDVPKISTTITPVIDYGVPKMLGIDLCSVRLWINRPITPQIRYPVIGYSGIARYTDLMRTSCQAVRKNRGRTWGKREKEKPE
jgi:hypothetical protein